MLIAHDARVLAVGQRIPVALVIGLRANIENMAANDAVYDQE